MKILYIKSGMHHKNHNAIINYKKINFYISDNINILNSIDLSQFDCVYIPSHPIDVKQFPNTKFLFGPHFSVFPENNQMNLIRGNNVVYIQPSEWVAKFWRESHITSNIRIESLPFGVDTEKFVNIYPIDKKEKVFIYYKRRNPEELQFLKSFLKSKNINVTIFNYVTKYSEEEFINYLKESKFGIWLTAHESQGFALEEALASNVPLLVWNVSSLNQEFGSRYDNIPATSIPYWDNRCGEHFTNANELPNVFAKFITNLNNYKPREYILENLSFDKCEEKFIKLINKI
jgi:glycosyltransferase involved in cell wall biosynthesis